MLKPLELRCLLKNSTRLALRAAYPSDWRRLRQSRIQFCLHLRIRACCGAIVPQHRLSPGALASSEISMYNSLSAVGMEGAREESQIPISNRSSGSETPSVTRNYSRDLTVSHEEMSLKSSRASGASFTLPFSSLPTRRHLYRVSPGLFASLMRIQ